MSKDEALTDERILDLFAEYGFASIHSLHETTVKEARALIAALSRPSGADAVAATEQPDFLYFECPECEFSSVQPATFKGSSACPMCAGDSGHDVSMSKRAARSTDKPEGKDARKHDEFSPPPVAAPPPPEPVAAAPDMVPAAWRYRWESDEGELSAWLVTNLRDPRDFEWPENKVIDVTPLYGPDVITTLSANLEAVTRERDSVLLGSRYWKDKATTAEAKLTACRAITQSQREEVARLTAAGTKFLGAVESVSGKVNKVHRETFRGALLPAKKDG